ncbi:hypothetical protein GCM10010267_21690 [Streptomyces griseorubens]|nr:hypothetical protein GCM10010267_21690 [Streptomyces griseorubens]
MLRIANGKLSGHMRTRTPPARVRAGRNGRPPLAPPYGPRAPCAPPLAFPGAA